MGLMGFDMGRVRLFPYTPVRFRVAPSKEKIHEKEIK